jgi:hypothetical protein
MLKFRLGEYSLAENYKRWHVIDGYHYCYVIGKVVRSSHVANLIHMNVFYWINSSMGQRITADHWVGPMIMLWFCWRNVRKIGNGDVSLCWYWSIYNTNVTSCTDNYVYRKFDGFVLLCFQNTPVSFNHILFAKMDKSPVINGYLYQRYISQDNKNNHIQRKIKNKSIRQMRWLHFLNRQFPFISSNISASPAYGVYISQLMRFPRACAQYNFQNRAQPLTQKLLKQCKVAPSLKSSLR